MMGQYRNRTGVWLALAVLVLWACFIGATWLGTDMQHQPGEGEAKLSLNAAQSQTVRKVVIDASVYGNPLEGVQRGVDKVKVLVTDAPDIALYYDKRYFSERMEQPFTWEVQGDTLHIRQQLGPDGEFARYATFTLYLPPHVAVIQGLALDVALNNQRPLSKLELQGSILLLSGSEQDRDQERPRTAPHVQQLMLRAMTPLTPKKHEGDFKYANEAAHVSLSAELQLPHVQLELGHGSADLFWQHMLDSHLQAAATPDSSVNLGAWGVQLQRRVVSEAETRQWLQEMQAIWPASQAETAAR